MAKNWPRLVPSWVFPFHTFQHCHIHADTITFASTCPLGHHLSAQQDMLSLWGLTSSTAVKHSCQLQRILFLKERLQFISFENKRKKNVLFFQKVCTHFIWDYWKRQKITPESRWLWGTCTTTGRDLPVLKDTKTHSEKLLCAPKHFLYKTQI